MNDEHPQQRRVGDAVWELALRYSAQMNESEFGQTFRSGTLSKHRYLGYISAMYPIVVGFNRVLIKGLAKVDHVRNSAFVRAMAEQLQEELAHNELWRGKLKQFGVDHHALYDTFEHYLASFTAAELERMTNDVIAHLRHNLSDTAPGCFPQPPFPEPVLALYHHLWISASDDNIPHWEHFASLACIGLHHFQCCFHVSLSRCRQQSGTQFGPEDNRVVERTRKTGQHVGTEEP